MTKVKDIVRGKLDGNQFREVDIYGEFIIKSDSGKQSTTHGGVYGFFVRLDANELQALRDEASEKGTWVIKETRPLKPMYENVYPLYWGKDKSVGARFNAHLKNPDGRNEGKAGTGLARLCAYKSLKDKTLAVFAICVTNYSEFESHLRSLFPDLLKTKNSKI